MDLSMQDVCQNAVSMEICGQSLGAFQASVHPIPCASTSSDAAQASLVGLRASPPAPVIAVPRGLAEDCSRKYLPPHVCGNASMKTGVPAEGARWDNL